MLLFVIAAVLMALAAAVVAYPLVGMPAEPYLKKGPRGADFSERDALLSALDDLEHAFLSRKLSQKDYEAQRETLEAEYVRAVEAAPKPQPRKGRRG